MDLYPSLSGWTCGVHSSAVSRSQTAFTVLRTNAYVKCTSLAGRCRVKGDCGCKHDTVDLWLCRVLQDLALAKVYAVKKLSYCAHTHARSFGSSMPVAIAVAMIHP